MANSRRNKLKQVRVRLKLEEDAPLYSTDRITSPQDAVRVIAGFLADLDRECCLVVNLDNEKHPINFNVVSIGATNESIVPIYNVFKSAMLSNASFVMMAHNHPGSVNETPEPSAHDMEATARVMAAGELLDIPLIDHIIVGRDIDNYYSFKRFFQDRFTAGRMKEEAQRGFMTECGFPFETEAQWDGRPDAAMKAIWPFQVNPALKL